MTTARSTRKRRLEKAGFAALPDGWVPADEAQRVADLVERHRAEVEKIAAAEPPLGRPRQGGMRRE